MKLTRSRFLAGLFGAIGISNAQQITVEAICQQPGWGPQVCNPANNQCPVCGTMAGKFVKPNEWDYYPSGYSEFKNGKREPINLVRCKRCNAAFWQDAEDK